MQRKHKINFRNYIRSVVVLALLIGWSLAAFTGFLLWFAPSGRGLGRVTLFLGLTRHEWGDIHFLISLIALCVTAVHLMLDWRALCKSIQYLIDVRRP
ncbi:DUF4405 domain-containing protein [Microseira sp. BLCC-F43]|jgi:hypothetical protein|uniref:DUF4405 domain-containing protein n=1 Tax=Microseira sp. BLCC-F43 TaxID=3153602 RepID=UPI0035B788C2